MEKTNQNEMQNFIRIIVIVVVIFVLFYLITILTTGKKKGTYTKAQTTPAVIQYDEIILGNLYKQKATEYYVLVEDKEDPYMSVLEGYLKQHSTKEGGIPYFTSDLASIFNKSFIGESSSFEQDNLKLTGPTLLKIREGLLVESYETSEGILEILKTLNA